jgi:hypothetical protein
VLDNQSKSLSSKYSRTGIARLSIPPRRIELFLERLANLDISNERRTKVFVESFADLLPKGGPPRPADGFQLTGVESHFQSVLQEIWRLPSPFHKEAALMMHAGFEQLGQTEQGFDGFLLVMLYAVKHAHLLRYCANPTCKEPYFVARRGSQIYCSSPCAKPAQKEAKLKWWNEHGAKRREKSRGKKGNHA